MTDDAEGVIPQKTSSESRFVSRRHTLYPQLLMVLGIAACSGGESSGRRDGSHVAADSSVPADEGMDDDRSDSPGGSDATAMNGSNESDASTSETDDGDRGETDTSRDDPPASDAGSSDAGSSDAGSSDAGSSDTGSSDTTSHSDPNSVDPNSSNDDTLMGEHDAGRVPDSWAASNVDAGSEATGDDDNTDDGVAEPELLVLPSAMLVSLQDASFYVFGAVDLGVPASTRKLVIVTHSASNNLVQYERVLVGDVEATKVASVGEDVEPSAPTAIFTLPFPEGENADIRMDLSTTVVRGAIAVYATYGLDSVEPDDVASVTSMEASTLTLDVSEPGIVIAGLGMASDAHAIADITNLNMAYDQVLIEGTPTLLAGGYGLTSSNQLELEIAAAVSTYNYRAVAAVFH